MDETATIAALEASMRAMTFYLDVSADCCKRIVQHEGALAMICRRLESAELSSQSSRDFAMQCIKVLELVCTREASAVHAAGGLQGTLAFLTNGGDSVFKDALLSAMGVVRSCCSRMEPTDEKLPACVDQLSLLLMHRDPATKQKALQCFATLADKFSRKQMDPSPLATGSLVSGLVELLQESTRDTTLDTSGATAVGRDLSTTRTVITLLNSLCHGSESITRGVLEANIVESLEVAVHTDEKVALDALRLIDLLFVVVFEGRDALPKVGLGFDRKHTAAKPPIMMSPRASSSISPNLHGWDISLPRFLCRRKASRSPAPYPRPLVVRIAP